MRARRRVRATGLLAACACAYACSAAPPARRDAGSEIDAALPEGGSALADAAEATEGDAAADAPDAADTDVGGSAADAAVSRCMPRAQETFVWPMLDAAAPDEGSVEADAGVSAPPPVLAAGPVVGAITDRSATIWVRSNAVARATLELWPHDEPSKARMLKGPTLAWATDFAGVFRITDLAPQTRYVFRVSLAHVGGEPEAVAAQGGLTTLPPAGSPARIRFAVGADITGAGDQPIFEQIASVAPHFALFIGDQIYADTLDPTLEAYAQKYVRNWNILHLRELMRVVPSFMIWDDHDIVDNYYAGSSTRYAPARAAYDLYVQSHNPEPMRTGELYYSFEAGDIGFFVLDVRSHRSPLVAADDASKTMLGPVQKADLLAWLACSQHHIKVVVSPVVFSRWARTGQDAWRGYATERDEILGFIADHAIEDVLLISGDQHWSAVFRTLHDGYRFYELLPTPLSKERSAAPAASTPEILARDDDHFVFGVVDIDTTVAPATIALTLCAEGKPCQPGEEPPPASSLDTEGGAETVPFTVHLTTADLGRR